MITKELFYLVSILEQLQQTAVLDSTPQLSLELGSVNDLVVTVPGRMEYQAGNRMAAAVLHAVL